MNKWNKNLDPNYAAAYIFQYRFSFSTRGGPFRITRSVIMVENRPTKFMAAIAMCGNEVMIEMSKVNRPHNMQGWYNLFKTGCATHFIAQKSGCVNLAVSLILAPQYQYLFQHDSRNHAFLSKSELSVLLHSSNHHQMAFIS